MSSNQSPYSYYLGDIVKIERTAQGQHVIVDKEIKGALLILTLVPLTYQKEITWDVQY